jgi:hypothetical protein
MKEKWIQFKYKIYYFLKKKIKYSNLKESHIQNNQNKPKAYDEVLYTKESVV